ncbi:phytase [Ammonicoccus fulvus]|uniref:Phytase n=1 Tax=Ammonicoccus fulvus TaxID=3138240 RepID=A0ABZ3FN95_9ACTN
MKTSFGAVAASALALALAAAGVQAHAAPAPKPVKSMTVTTDNETPVLYDDEEGGNASGDDPAIWVDPVNSANSLVIVTAKGGGLYVYDLGSKELQHLPATPLPNDGRFNNVDIAYGVKVGGQTLDLAVVSDRYNDSIRFFAIDPAGARAGQPLREVTAADQAYLFVRNAAELEDEHTAYGLAVWQPRNGNEAYAVVTQEGRTNLAVARIVGNADGTVGYEVERTITMPGQFVLPDGTTWIPCEEPGVEPQFEGVTVDNRSGILYAAQEDVGLWRIDLENRNKKPELIDKVTDFGVHDRFDPETEACEPIGEDKGYGGNITADAEGVDLYYGPGTTGYIILSSQGSDEFFVYERQGRNKLVGSFKVDGINGADAIHGSDGLAVTNRPVGQYTEGLLVTHDEPESGPGVDDERDPTNFSYVSWGDIARALDLKINTTAKNDPRFR